MSATNDRLMRVGAQRYVSAAAMLVVWLLLISMRFRDETVWPVIAAYGVGGLAAWRFAWHHHMHEVDESNREQKEREYRRTLVTVAAAFAGLTSLAWLL